MPSSFPTVYDVFTSKVDGVSDVLAADINNVQDAVVAIEQNIGLAAKGSMASLAARLAVSLNLDGTLTSGSFSSLPDGSITTAKLAGAAVTTAKLAAGAVTTAVIADGAVTNAKLAASAVQTSNIGNTQVTDQKISAVDAAKITTGQVATARVHLGATILLRQAFTPGGTGADIAEIMVPYDPADGTTSVVWNVRRIWLRVNVAGGAPALTVEKSTAAGVFSATSVGTLTMSTGAYEVTNAAALGTVNSGDKLRFNVSTLATATGWTVAVELGT